MNEVIRLGVICDQFGNLQRGGAEAQVENTIAALQKTGLVSVEYITHETTDLSKFDLIHFFKSSFEYTPVAITLAEKEIPYVVSTIIYPKNFRLEVLAYNLTRIFPKKLKSLLSISRRVQLWDKASALFPNTIDEAKFISNVTKNNFVKVVPNGLDLYEMTDVSKDLFETEYPFFEESEICFKCGESGTQKESEIIGSGL
ncbi:hypothetical protein NXY12_20255 [Bacteroides fragilis]|nr:hypothetical protein NXY12_20255 [Bacteroides fragilis]